MAQRGRPRKTEQAAPAASKAPAAPKENSTRTRGIARPDVIKRIGDTLKDYRSAYLFWRFCPDALPPDIPAGCSFQVLKQKSGMPDVITEQAAALWLLDDGTQQLVKSLLEAKKGLQMLELHDIYYERAKNDANSLKALLQLDETLFKNEQNALLALLDNVPDDVIGDTEDAQK
jgi:hypothetical protein